MGMNQKQFYILLGLLAVTAVVAINPDDYDLSDENVDDIFPFFEAAADDETPLTRLRSLMTGQTLGFDPLIAYIIPSDNEHQVSLIIQVKF